MNDAENLSRLLGHLPPAVFHEFVTQESDVEIAEVDAKASKRDQRAGIEAALDTLTVKERQRLEEYAERIVLLSDGPGQDVVEGLREDIFDDTDRAVFAAIRNQYERSVWLYLHARDLFDEGLDARQADLFRQSPSCYSGFVAPKGLAVLSEASTREAFHRSVAQQLGCTSDAVAVQVFKRLRPDSETGADVNLYQISIHYNRPPEMIDCVKDSELVPNEVIRAVSAHVTYEPTNGHLEVLSKDTQGRSMLARTVADLLLRSPISGDRIPLKQYDYQSLAAPRSLDLSGEGVASVKVVALGFSRAKQRSVVVEIGTRDPDDIYTVTREDIAPAFDFRQCPLNYAKLHIRLQRVGKGRQRSLTIILRGDNRCNVKSKREKDRALCDRLLGKWRLVREIVDEAGHADDARAA